MVELASGTEANREVMGHNPPSGVAVNEANPRPKAAAGPGKRQGSTIDTAGIGGSDMTGKGTSVVEVGAGDVDPPQATDGGGNRWVSAGGVPGGLRSHRYGGCRCPPSPVRAMEAH